MNVIIINPPLVQLNAPYPSGAYLCDFFKGEGCNAKWFDLSNHLFRAIFSSDGLQSLFELSSDSALQMAERSEREGDEAAAFNLRRYVSCAPAWIEWIDFIVGMLCTGRADFSERELCHKFLFSPFAPRGNRMETFLSGLEREPTVDDVRFLCSYALADLADYITAVFDNDFSLIRYAEALTVDESSFAQIEKRLNSPVLEEFYKPVCCLNLCRVYIPLSSLGNPDIVVLCREFDYRVIHEHLSGNAPFLNNGLYSGFVLWFKPDRYACPVAFSRNALHFYAVFHFAPVFGLDFL